MERRAFLQMLGKASLVGSALILPRQASAYATAGPWQWDTGRQEWRQQWDVGISMTAATAMAMTITQYATQWCWAASIETVFRLWGYRVHQLRIVQQTWGTIVNMPANTERILYDLNRTWIDDTGKRFLVQSYIRPTVSDIASDLRNNRPALLGYHNPDGTGHAVVLTALRYYTYYPSRSTAVLSETVHDPWPGQGNRLLSARQFYGTSFLARIQLVRL